MPIFFVVIFGCLALICKCHPQLLEARGTTNFPDSVPSTSLNAIAVKNKSLGEIKFTVQFCTKQLCGKTAIPCYCCENQKPEAVCYGTIEACQTICPKCDPICPPPQPSTQVITEGPPSNAVNASTS
ncbi:hypothetical protein HU200_037705 [Digitaria exilis]|uniref:Uncharacterized protein n=1 Tax=Digitaria exilis TaxID=1010633 RepID=A0A835BE55_9POAL|nr:hypothetical protein HU200_037705 [Digitaria exilis]